MLHFLVSMLDLMCLLIRKRLVVLAGSGLRNLRLRRFFMLMGLGRICVWMICCRWLFVWSANRCLCHWLRSSCGQLGREMPIGTLLSVFKQAQIEREWNNG